MKKLSHIAIASLALATVSAPASAFINNWMLDVDGPGGSAAATVSEYLDFIGNSFIQNTFAGYPSDGSSGAPPAGTAFTFTDSGVFRTSSIDGSSIISDLFPGPPSYEMTAVFDGATGSGTLGGALTFDPGATLTFWSDNSLASRYGSTAGIYGADNGPTMGTFTLTSGSGQVNASGIPAGFITLTFEADGTDLTCGYWFDPLGNDLCGTDVTIGFVTINVVRITNPPANLPPELVCQLEDFNCPSGTPFDNVPWSFILSNNGQFRLQEAPEPGTVALLGLGLAGLGLRRRLCRA